MSLVSGSWIAGTDFKTEIGKFFESFAILTPNSIPQSWQQDNSSSNNKELKGKRINSSLFC
jgi:hypothetical protein